MSGDFFDFLHGNRFLFLFFDKFPLIFLIVKAQHMNFSDSYDISFMLLMKYKSPVVQLDTILKDFLPHISLASAKKRAALQTLPFPVFKAESSQKAPYLVNLMELAKYLSDQSVVGYKDWNSMNK